MVDFYNLAIGEVEVGRYDGGCAEIFMVIYSNQHNIQKTPYHPSNVAG